MLGYVTLLVLVLVLIILDVFWFSWSLEHVYKGIFDIKTNPLSVGFGALIAWILIGFGIKYFVIDSGKGSLSGALFGFIVYGVYNATNYALYKDYTLSTAIIDTMWGTFAAGVASSVAISFNNWYYPH